MFKFNQEEKIIRIENIEYRDIDVPADGSCLLYSVALSFLLPLLEDNTAFKEAFILLFGEDEVESNFEEIKNFLTNYDGSVNCVRNSTFMNLVKNNFRTALANYMCDNNTDEKYSQFLFDGQNFDDYLKRNIQPTTFLGDMELFALSDFLRRSIIKYQEGCSPRIYGEDYKQYIPLRLVFLQLEVKLNEDEDGHYHYLIEPQFIRGQMENKKKLEEVDFFKEEVKKEKNDRDSVTKKLDFSEGFANKTDEFYLDDSSDEESINDALTDYNINDSYEEFKTRENGRLWNIFTATSLYNLTEEQVQSAFLLRVAGLNLLYQKEVNAFYYKSLKPEHLGIKKFPVELEVWLRNVLQKTIEELIERLQGYFAIHENKQEAFNNKLKQFKKNIVIALISKELIHDLLEDRFILQKKKYEDLDAKSKDILDKLVASIFLEFNEFFEQDTYSYKSPLNGNDFKNIQFNEIQKKLGKLAIAKSLKVLNELEWLKPNSNAKIGEEASYKTPPKKTIKKKSVSPSIDLEQTVYKHLVNHAYEKHSNERAGKIITDNKDNLLKEDTKNEHALYYFTDLIKIESNSPKTPDTEAWQITNDIPELKQFFEINKERVEYDLTEYFKQLFTSNLKKLSFDYERKTLELQFKFISQNPTGFFANLHLSNCSQKREIRNIKNNELLSSFYEGNQLITNSRSWSFGKQNEALETQGIVVSSSGRKDEVENIGSYQVVYEKIKQLKEKFLTPLFKESKISIEQEPNIFDSLIAEWLRRIINNRPLLGIDNQYLNLSKLKKPFETTLKKILTHIAYLLFGCEVARNPAGIVINQMMLDLIQWGKLTWEEALTNNIEKYTGYLLYLVPEFKKEELLKTITTGKTVILTNSNQAYFIIEGEFLMSKKDKEKNSTIFSLTSVNRYNLLQVEETGEWVQEFKILNEVVWAIIEKGGDKLEKALDDRFIDGGRMPMSPDGAVGVARTLQNHFNPFMQYPYSYQGTPSGTKNEIAIMVQREDWIFRTWFKELKKEIKFVDLKEMQVFIIEHAERWYFNHQVKKILTLPTPKNSM